MISDEGIDAVLKQGEKQNKVNKWLHSFKNDTGFTIASWATEAHLLAEAQRLADFENQIANNMDRAIIEAFSKSI